MTKVNGYDLKNIVWTTTGIAPNYEVNIPREDDTSLQGQILTIKLHQDSSSDIFLNINGLGAKQIFDIGNNPVNNIKAGTIIQIEYGPTLKMLRFVGSSMVNNLRVYSAGYTDMGDYDLYTFSGTGITTYSEEDWFVIKIDHTNSNGVSKINIDGIGEKFIYTPKGDNLKAESLEIDNTYLLRYDESLDAFTIMVTQDVNITNVNDKFIDLKAYDIGSSTYPLSSGTVSDTNGIIYDGERYLYISDGLDDKMFKFDTWTNTAVLEVSMSGQPFHDLSYIPSLNYILVPLNLYNGFNIIDTNLNIIQTVNTPQPTLATEYDEINNIGYILGRGNPAEVYVYDFNTMSLINTITLPWNTETGATIYLYNGYIFVTQGGYAYSTGYSHICRININNYSEIIDLDLQQNIVSGMIGYGNYLFVDSHTDNLVIKVDYINMTKISTLNIGAEPSVKPAVKNKYGYFPCENSNAVYVVDLETFTVVGNPLPTAIGPQEVIIVGNAIYVANEGSGNLSRIGIDQLIAPPDGYYRLYFKSDGKLYRMDSNGNEELIGTQV